MKEKGTDNFKKAIQEYLDKRAEEDPLFAETLKKEDKTLEECINYIFSQVKKIGAMGYTDDEIYGMAVHYYDEDDLEKADPIKCGVVVNHKPELNEEEIEELKEQARKEVIQETKNRMRSKKKQSSGKKQKPEQLSLLS